MWGGVFEYPIFLYAFEDGRRFLCIVDDDTAISVFVVDFTGTSATATNLPLWPTDWDTRTYLAGRGTNWVITTNAVVRLPNYQEVQRASCDISGYTERQFRAASLPVWDLSFWRAYWPKKALLSALATNRHSAWPDWQHER